MSRLTVGILAAMPQECRSLTPQRVPDDGFLALDEGCVLALSGAGPAAAARCAAALAQRGVSALLSWGCAAALDPRLMPGDLALPERIVGADGDALAPDPIWRARLADRLAPHLAAYSGSLLESRRIVSAAAEKRALFADSGAIVLDMESAAAARVARDFKLPFLAVRSVVDPADIDIPPSVAAAFDENGALQVPKMLGRALARPVDFIGIIRLGRHFGAASRTLEAVADLARAQRFALG